ncbi:hypothetical protein LLG95_12695 [bacterium]|nr:hypothetical protein [bacterium]
MMFLKITHLLLSLVMIFQALCVLTCAVVVVISYHTGIPEKTEYLETLGINALLLALVLALWIMTRRKKPTKNENESQFAE